MPAPADLSVSSTARWRTRLVLAILLVLLAAAALTVAVLVKPARTAAPGAASAAGGSEPLALALDRALQRRPSAKTSGIAIRPLETGAADAELAALGETLCVLLVQRLARLDAVRVTACDSTKVALAGGLDDQRLARLLGVDHLLVGRIERLPDARVRLSAALVEVAGGRRRWHLEGDYTQGELQAVPGQMAERTRAALRVADTARAQPAVPGAAFDKFLQAQQVLARATPTEFGQARQLLDEALALAPQFMAARLAQVRLRLSRLRFATPEELRDFDKLMAEQQAGLRASESLGPELLATDPGDADGHSLLANAAAQSRRWSAAMRHVDAVTTSPTRSAAALQSAAHLLAMAGYVRAALEQMLEAARLDPLSAQRHLNLALFHGLLGDTARMRESARLAQELGSRMAVVYNGIAALRERDWPQAEAATVDALRGAGIESGWVAGFVRGAADPAAREAAARQIEALPSRPTAARSR
jgi:TolB-like protein